MAAGADEAIHWQAGELAIDLDSVPLGQAMALLSKATGGVVNGADRVPAASRVTLHWRSANVAAAWQALLQGRARFSSSCTSSSCSVWITGASVEPSTAHASPSDVPPRQNHEDESPPANVSQPDGSC